MTDKIGQQIDVGSLVIFIEPVYKSFRWRIGLVEGFTDKMVKIVQTDLETTDKSKTELSKRSPKSLIVVSELKQLYHLESVGYLMGKIV